MKILVVGGAGYIGGACTRILLKRGHEVAVFDNLSNSYSSQIPAEVSFYEGDLLNRETLLHALRDSEAEAVIHFAAKISVGESVKEPLPYFYNNTVGTENLLKCMKEAEVKKLVFSSTAAVYGEVTEKNVPIVETMPRIPVNPYGQSKVACEWMAEGCCEAWGLNATMLRYFNVCGALEDCSHGETHKQEEHLIPLAIQYALGDRDKFAIFGDDFNTPDGTCIRDYIHVYDLVVAHALAIEAQQEGFNAFNLGSGNGFSNLEIIEAVKQVTGNMRDVPTVGRRPGDPARLIADSTKAETELGWTRKYDDIHKIVASAFEWHKGIKEGSIVLEG